jgi:predicted negative regulator of RcsB-dependent stress response
VPASPFDAPVPDSPPPAAHPIALPAEGARVRLAAGGLLLATVAAYADSLRGAFVFDDPLSTVGNPTLRRWSTAFFPPGNGVTVQGRPFLNLSFALNWHLAGPDVWSYHALNLLIHVAAACTLFGLVRRTALRLDWARDRATELAFVPALLWAVHPLTTEAVAYVAQRAESLAGFLVLFTLYAFVRHADGGPGRRRWAAASLLSCFLAISTKEIAVTAPVLVWAYDRTFLSGSFAAAWRRHGRILLALFLTWLPLLVLVLGAGTRGGTSGFGPRVGVTPLAYYATQPRALCRYLLQVFWPHPLIFDYGTQWVRTPAEVVPYAIIVALLAALTAAAFLRRTPAGYLGVFCFAVLSVNTLIPGNRQTSAEHRMYLPLAALLVLAVVGGYRLWRPRRPASYLAGCAVLALPLALLTAARNRAYRTEVALFRDTVEKLPTNAFARYNLGAALLRSGQAAQAATQLQAALTADPGLLVAYARLAEADRKLGRFPEACQRCLAALRLDANDVEARYQLGLAYLAEGRTAEAAEQFNDAVLVRPDFTPARDALAKLQRAAGVR